MNFDRETFYNKEIIFRVFIKIIPGILFLLGMIIILINIW
jgi:hypothetical protein